MKPSLKKIIVDTSRFAWLDSGDSRRARAKALLRRDPELLPEYSDMKAGLWDPRWQSDRLAPLFRFLRERVGSRWDEVWSEISAVNDSRSVLGHHLRCHAEGMIVTVHDLRMRRRNFHQLEYLYVDGDGILRFHAPERACSQAGRNE